MHAEISQPGPGSCPKCGMPLVPRTEMANDRASPGEGTPAQAKTYTCPMHPDVRQDQPGNCPKCGMTLIESSQTQTGEVKTYTCPMHPEVRQSQPGSCPKCGMTLIETDNAPQAQATSGHQEMSMEHTDQSIHDMSMDMNASATGEHNMNMSHHDMHMSSMTPRQYYDMMVGMAMSTAQLPWAIVLGAASALLLIVLVILIPWPLAHASPTQDATNAVGQLLLSRYMIGFEGAAFLILAGIAGAVLLAKRESMPQQQSQTQHARSDETPAGTILYTCPMHPEVRESHPGSCPKCGMTLLPVEETPSSAGAQPTRKHGGHS
jgi:predicted nucleic-acid-binding Zn-ribbon protein